MNPAIDRTITVDRLAFDDRAYILSSKDSPGGRGIKLRLSNPMLLDDVAADFPGMPVILAHPSVPWPSCWSSRSSIARDRDRGNRGLCPGPQSCYVRALPGAGPRP